MKEKIAVFLYAYTPSCGFCAKMEKEVFVNEEVADYYNVTFVSYKINIEDDAEGASLAKKYAIVGFPTYLYFNEEGVLLHQSGSLKLANRFILNGQNALNPQKALFSLKKRYDNGERSDDYSLIIAMPFPTIIIKTVSCCLTLNGRFSVISETYPSSLISCVNYRVILPFLLAVIYLIRNYRKVK